jgi:hypothetical protein
MFRTITGVNNNEILLDFRTKMLGISGFSHPKIRDSLIALDI